MNQKNSLFSKNPVTIKEMFDSISKNYDMLNDIMSFGQHRKIKESIVNQVKSFSFDSSPRTFLDLCTGTGDLAGLLKQQFPDNKIVGIDFSEKMLEIARKKHPGIEFINADCTQLPFEDGQFDLCIISFGLRNIENMQQALKEIHRVLKKGGVFINIDLGKPNNFFNLFLKPYMYFWVSFVGKIFHGDQTPYRYLAESNENFPSQMELVEIYKNLGFSNIKNKNYLFGQIASQIAIK